MEHCKFYIVLLITFVISIENTVSVTRKEQLQSMRLPPCKACKTLHESFKKVRIVHIILTGLSFSIIFQNLAKTEKGKFEGGDAAWEEEKLGSYARSEVRLVEIQENLCKEVEEGQNQCFSLAEMHDTLIEEWWFKHQDKQPGNT